MISLWIISVFIYMLPSIVATARVHTLGIKRFVNVIATNYFLGWLIIPWFIALAMACKRGDGSAREYNLTDYYDL